MLLLKILGGIDLIASLTFMTFIFGFHPWIQLVLFSAGLLLLKGMFIFKGEVLSIIDVLSAIFLLLSVLFSVPVIILWPLAFLLIAKGLVSFM